MLTGVAAIALAFGLVQLLSSQPGSSVVSDGASSVNGVEAATAGGTLPHRRGVSSPRSEHRRRSDDDDRSGRRVRPAGAAEHTADGTRPVRHRLGRRHVGGHHRGRGWHSVRPPM